MSFPILEKCGTCKHVAYSLIVPFSGVLTERFNFGECVSTFRRFRSVLWRFWGFLGTCIRCSASKALRSVPGRLRRIDEVVGSIGGRIVLVDSIKESDLCLGEILVDSVHVAWLHVVT